MFSRDIFIRLLLYGTSMTLIFIIPLALALLGQYYRDFYLPLLVSGFMSIVIGAIIALKKLN
ncbi:hypothetical protein, partial [[Eubacterium] cellulosolvens]